LTHRQAAALSGELYRAWADEDRAEVVAVEQAAEGGWQRFEESSEEREATAEAVVRMWERLGADSNASKLESALGPLVERLLARKGVGPITTTSRGRVLHEFWRAMRDAFANRKRNAEGDYRPDPKSDRFPEWRSPPHGATGKLALPALFERWAMHPENTNLSASTKKAYGSACTAVSRFLGEPDARAITTDSLNNYFDARMAWAEGTRPLAPRVARDVHKGALGSIYAWAVGKRLVQQNPAEGVRIKVARSTTLRSKAATDAEARAFAATTLSLPEDVPSRTLEAAKRWCGLMLLYTGCRVGELTQLRKADAEIITRGNAVLRITPEAGKVKGRRVRLVPVHPRLVKLGLLGFVRGAADGALFFDPKSRRHPGAAMSQADLSRRKLATWSRSVGLGDPLLKRRLHALRHRFMTIARLSGIEEQYTEALAGHSSGRTESQLRGVSAGRAAPGNPEA
jgi:integrase